MNTYVVGTGLGAKTIQAHTFQVHSNGTVVFYDKHERALAAIPAGMYDHITTEQSSEVQLLTE
jgi:thioredoxin-related protein